MSSRVFREGLLAGQRALVTGGGTGIGRAIALELAGLGADVALLGRRIEKLDVVRAEIEARGRKALCVPADLRDAEAVRAAVARVNEQFSGIDILVNNAGGGFVKEAKDVSDKGWAAVVDLNLTGTFRITQEVARTAMLPARSGSIVNIVIDTAHGVPGAAHSGAARAAVENLTKSLSTEWAPHGVRVNAVAPGTIETDALSMYPPRVIDALKSVVPLGRLGKPEEVAWMVAFLASDAAEWVTGGVFAIDGGSRNVGAHWNVFQTASKETAR